MKAFINKKQIGNDLTDNSYISDGYRFHDVFHFSYKNILIKIILVICQKIVMFINLLNIYLHVHVMGMGLSSITVTVDLRQ